MLVRYNIRFYVNNSSGFEFLSRGPGDIIRYYATLAGLRFICCGTYMYYKLDGTKQIEEATKLLVGNKEGKERKIAQTVMSSLLSKQRIQDEQHREITNTNTN